MKKFLPILLVLALLFTLSIPALAADDEDLANTPMLINDLEGEPVGSVGMSNATVILHSNDVHGAIDGYAKMAALKAEHQSKGDTVLVLDAGDFSQGTTLVSLSQGATAIELMNMVGYDAAAPGNHEFDYGYENLKALQAKADFPIMAGNLSYNNENLLGHEDYVILEGANGLKIGVFGLDTPETATKAHPAKIKGVVFEGGDALAAKAQSFVDILKGKGVDVIICLAHLGIDEESAVNSNRSIDMLKSVTGIDVLIDGHSHSTEDKIVAATNADRTVNGTVVTSTGSEFKNIGVIVINGDKEITTTTVDTETIVVPEDDPIAARVAAIKAEIAADFGATFAASEVDLNGAKAPGNRTEETNLGDLITDALLWKANAAGETVDAAITNGGGIRAAVATGNITKNDINTVLPFGNTLNIVKIKGSELLEILEASTFCTPDAIGGFPQVSGIVFAVDTSKAYDPGENYPGTTYAAPKTINRVTIATVGGKAFDPNATYSIATNDFLASGGDTYYAFTTATANYDLGIPMDEVVMEYITEELGGTVTAAAYGAPAGRIVAADGAVAEVPATGDVSYLYLVGAFVAAGAVALLAKKKRA